MHVNVNAFQIYTNIVRVRIVCERTGKSDHRCSDKIGSVALYLTPGIRSDGASGVE